MSLDGTQFSFWMGDEQQHRTKSPLKAELRTIVLQLTIFCKRYSSS